MENNINEKIKEYMLSTLSKEMKNESNKIRLESEDLQSFNICMRFLQKHMNTLMNLMKKI